MKSQIPQLIGIVVHYQGTISTITEKECEGIQIVQGMPFLMLLNLVFEIYPEIMKTYPPGRIGLMLNDHPPTDFEAMKDNDQVYLTTSEHFVN